MQNKILKCIHNVPRNFPTHTLHDISGIETINHGPTLLKGRGFNRTKIKKENFGRRLRK